MWDLHTLFWVEEPISPKIREVLRLCWDILNIIPNPRLRLDSKRRLIENLETLSDEQLDSLLWLGRTLSMKDISLLFKEELLAALER